MNNQQSPAGGKVRIGFALFTINGGGVYNPRSRRVILEARERFGRTGFIFPSVEEASQRKPVAGMVALIDMECIGQPILDTEELQPMESLVPSWAREPMSKLHFGICLSHDVRQAVVEETVRRIIRYCEPFFPEDEPLLGSRERLERDRRAYNHEMLVRQEYARKNARREHLHPLRHPRRVVSQF